MLLSQLTPDCWTPLLDVFGEGYIVLDGLDRLRWLSHTKADFRRRLLHSLQILFVVDTDSNQPVFLKKVLIFDAFTHSMLQILQVLRCLIFHSQKLFKFIDLPTILLGNHKIKYSGKVQLFVDILSTFVSKAFLESADSDLSVSQLLTESLRSVFVVRL